MKLYMVDAQDSSRELLEIINSFSNVIWNMLAEIWELFYTPVTNIQGRQLSAWRH